MKAESASQPGRAAPSVPMPSSDFPAPPLLLRLSAILRRAFCATLAGLPPSALPPSAFPLPCCLLPAACCLLPLSAAAETLTLAQLPAGNGRGTAPPSSSSSSPSNSAYGGAADPARSRALPTLGDHRRSSGYQGSSRFRGNAAHPPASQRGNGKPLPQNITSDSRNSTAFILLATGTALTQPIFDAPIPASWRRGHARASHAPPGKPSTRSRYGANCFRAHTLFVAGALRSSKAASRCCAGHQPDCSQRTSWTRQNAARSTPVSWAARSGRAHRPGAARRTSRPSILSTTPAASAPTSPTLLQVMGRRVPAARQPGRPARRSITLAGNGWTSGPLGLRARPQPPGSAPSPRRPDLQCPACTEIKTAVDEDANVARGGYYPKIQHLPRRPVPCRRTYVSSANNPDATRESDQRRDVTELRPGIRLADWNDHRHGRRCAAPDAARPDAMRDQISRRQPAPAWKSRHSLGTRPGDRTPARPTPPARGWRR